MPQFRLVTWANVRHRLVTMVTCLCGRRCTIVSKSLFYNEHLSVNYVVDSLFEPVIWLVENYARRFGPVFVGFLLSMIGVMVSLTYTIIIPFEITRKSYIEIVIYLFMGHWLLLNTLFNYSMAFSQGPGYLPTNRTIEPVVGFCKHCMAPKPPRTHHCSVCNRCILKMDHHCPWLNRCVGHWNHRYFFFTMMYMWSGCLLILIGMWPCFWEHYWINNSLWCDEMEGVLFYSSWLCNDNRIHNHNNDNDTWSVDDHLDNDKHIKSPLYGQSAYNCIILVFLVCMGMVVGLGALITWHCKLISNAETSIEHHINADMVKRCSKDGKPYINPYDFGWKHNWRIFLGIQRGSNRTFIRHILWPSTHPPDGDGMKWRTVRDIQPIESVKTT